MSDDATCYEIDLTQGDLAIQLISDDAAFIADQMNRWSQLLFDDRYQPIAIPPTPVVTLPQPEPIPVREPTPPPPPEAHVDIAPTDQTQLLLEQIQQLQQQVSVLAEQTTHVPLPQSFEQPVDNPPPPVENIPPEPPETIPEPSAPPAFSHPPPAFQHPVQNHPEPVEMPPAPPQQQDADGNDLDLLLDSLILDLNEPEPQLQQAIETPTPQFEPPPPPEPQHVEPPQPIAPKQPQPVAQDIDPIPMGESTLFDQELTSLFEEAATSTAVYNADQEQQVIPLQEHEPPAVHYDFGIPGPAPVDDPALRKLSLESLQDSTPFGESTFPNVDDENLEIPHVKVTESYSDKGQPQYPAQPIASAPKSPDEIETLADLCALVPGAEGGTDFLLLAAYFLTGYIVMEKYTLKDLNAQLVKSGLTPVNHGILESAISQEYLELVPDLTGTANAAEYTLTDKGIQYTQSLVGT